MGRAESAGKPALPRGSIELRIGQPGVCQPKQPPNLFFIARLGLQLTNAHQIVQLSQTHGSLPITTNTGCDSTRFTNESGSPRRSSNSFGV